MQSAANSVRVKGNVIRISRIFGSFLRVTATTISLVFLCSNFHIVTRREIRRNSYVLILPQLYLQGNGVLTFET